MVDCDTEDGEVWDSNFGSNYVASRKDFKVLTLNLHCYQEDNQHRKFSQIAKAINELGVDVVCLQEVCEYWNDGRGDSSSNAARVIRDRLTTQYYLHADSSHIGFDRFLEGVAILSRYELLLKDSGYVSHSQEMLDIHSRKAVMAQVHVPYMGRVNVFSIHLSWWSDGFKEQFQRLRDWANQKHSDTVVATLLAGDFNSEAGSQGYELIVAAGDYEDQFLKALSPNIFDQIFSSPSDGWQRLLEKDGRIDYILMNAGSPLKVTSARVLFSDQDYGRVSDHLGFLMAFEPV